MKLKRHSIWPIALIIAIFIASNQSSVAIPKLGFSHDKIVHLLVFGLLATSLFRIPYFFTKRWKGILVTVLIVAAYGAVDEFHQMFIEGRYVEFNDWMADTFGAILASILYLKWDRYRSILEKPMFPKETRKSSLIWRKTLHHSKAPAATTDIATSE